MQANTRRFDIDWWRVIAIIGVYLHHIGMPFNGDDFHIINDQSSKLLDDIMVFFEQFRLPLLFTISGVGTVYAFSKRNAWQFIKERAYRLLIPLIFGVLVIVPPQTYFEHKESYASYWDVYSNLFSNLEANHLWFIENLFYISIAALPLIIFFRSKKSQKLLHFLNKLSRKRYGMFLFVIPLLAIKIISKKYYPDDSKDITNLSSTLFYGYFFFMGIVITSSKQMWTHLKRFRRFNLIVASASILLFYTYYFLPQEIVATHLTIPTRWSIWHGISALVSWTLICTALGYGQVWFQKPSQLLFRLNEGIYPFYILHQTVLIVVGYYIIPLSMPIALKIGLLLLITFPVIIILYRTLVYPFKLARVMFGMKRKSKE
jgi:hypothetical protein